MSSPLPGWLCKEVHRHRLKKNVWSKLLSPEKALLRVKNFLDEAMELPDPDSVAKPPLVAPSGSVSAVSSRF